MACSLPIWRQSSTAGSTTPCPSLESRWICCSVSPNGVEWHTTTEVVEWLVMDHFLRALPPKQCKAMGMRDTDSPREMLESLEHTLATLDMGIILS